MLQKMIRKMFGETEEEQYRYLKPRLLAIALSQVPSIIAFLVFLLFVLFGIQTNVIGALLNACIFLGSCCVVIVMLNFGWAVVRALFGLASLGVLLSRDAVTVVIVLLFYLFIGCYAGLIAAVIGLCHFLVLLKRRKNRG